MKMKATQQQSRVRNSNNGTRARRAQLALAAIAGVTTFAGVAGAAELTWTGAVNHTWDATNPSFTATANWSSGGGAVQWTVGDNATFTDNFAGTNTTLDVGTLGLTG